MRSHRLFLLLFSVFGTLVGVAAAAALAAKSTEDFVRTAAGANEFEIESSQLALSRSQDGNVRKFAQEMVDDHTAAGDKLRSILPRAGLGDGLLPSALDAAHLQQLDALTKAQEPDFDRRYVADQVAAHKEAVSLFENYAKEGDNSVIRAFTDETLPVLRRHQEHAAALADRM